MEILTERALHLEYSWYLHILVIEDRKVNEVRQVNFSVFSVQALGDLKIKQ